MCVPTSFKEILRSSFKLSLLNNQIQIWYFVFVTLFNLQGARRSLAAGVYFTISFRPCQALFQVFHNFFEALAGPNLQAQLPGRPRGRPVYITTASSLCQVLFSNLFRFVSALYAARRGRTCFPQALSYHSKLFLPCQSLFSDFSVFFSGFSPAAISSAFSAVLYTRYGS